MIPNIVGGKEKYNKKNDQKDKIDRVIGGKSFEIESVKIQAIINVASSARTRDIAAHLIFCYKF